MASGVYTHNQFSPPHLPVQTQPLKQSKQMASEQQSPNQFIYAKPPIKKAPPPLRKVSSTRYAIGYRSSSTKRVKSRTLS